MKFNLKGKIEQAMKFNLEKAKIEQTLHIYCMQLISDENVSSETKNLILEELCAERAVLMKDRREKRRIIYYFITMSAIVALGRYGLNLAYSHRQCA